MKRENETKNEAQKKSFLAKVIERLDKKMQEKAKSAPCCCKPKDKDKGDNSCCS